MRLAITRSVPFLAFASLLGPHGATRGDTILVPEDYPTIQQAIDAATDGDEIIVAPDTYYEAINLLGKAIHLRSSGGPGATRINAEGLSTSVVTCASGEGADTIIEGFTITHGIGTLGRRGEERNGGGVYIVGSDPTIQDCTIIRNAAARGAGGGIYIDGGSSTIQGCHIDQNTATANGGGIALRGSSTIQDCVLAGNSCGSQGGGIYSRGWPDATISRCAFVGNSARRGGGGLDNRDGHVLVADSVFNGNSGGTHGGGALLDEDSGNELVNCVFSGNEAAVGGGVFIEQASATLMNCALLGNRATLGGGLAAESRSWAQVVNATFSGNSAALGGAYYFTGRGTGENVALTSCILWGDKPTEIDGDVLVTHSDIQGGFPGEGNISADPGFTTAHTGTWTSFWDRGDQHVRLLQDDAARWAPDELVGLVVQPDVDIDKQFIIIGNDSDTVTIWTDWVRMIWLRPGAEYAIHDYRLSAGSPAIDAGNNEAVPPDTFDLDEDGDTEEATPLDHDGNPRLADDPDSEDTGIGCFVADMGAWEFPAEGPGRSAAPPPNLEASDGEYADRITVSWDAPQCIDEYRVFRNTEDDPDASTPVTDWQRDLWFDDTGVEPGRVHWYWVIARNEHSESGWSDGDSGYRVDSPSPPTDLQATDGDHADRVDLDWEPSQTAEDYLVFRHTKNDPDASSPIGDWTPETSFSDRTAEPERVYWYWVKARNENGESGRSEGESGFRFGVPPPPEDLRATDGDPDQVRVIWASAHTAWDYRVFRHVENDPFDSEPISDWQRSTGFSDRTAEPGRIYLYWIVARNLNGESDWSDGDCGFRRDPDRCVRSSHSCCDGDVNGDGLVNPVDFGLVRANFGNTSEQALCDYDMDCDGKINPVDSGIVQSLFGTCEAPRGACP